MCEPDIKTYYDLNEDLVRRDQGIYNLAAGQPAGSKNFAGGRVVIIRDGVRAFISACLYGKVNLPLLSTSRGMLPCSSRRRPLSPQTAAS